METIYTKRESLIKNIEKYYYFCKVKSSIMVKLEEIKKTIEKEINCFESEFKESFKASSELLNNINQYILNKRGKGIRPILTLLAAKAYGEINETTIKSAIISDPVFAVVKPHLLHPVITNLPLSFLEYLPIYATLSSVMQSCAANLLTIFADG